MRDLIAPPGRLGPPGETVSPGHTVPPGHRVSPGANTAQALFMEARRRRRRRWRAGIAAFLAAVAVMAVPAVTWLPGAYDRVTGRAGAAGAVLAGQSSAAAGRATISYRVVTAGVPEAYGTDRITFSGQNRTSSFANTILAAGPAPTMQADEGTERIVKGQAYDYFRVRGRMTWVRAGDPQYPVIKIVDPRTLLHVLGRFTRFRVVGDQTMGGARLTLLHATDPGNLSQRGVLPVAFPIYLSVQPVVALDVWVDGQGVVHRMSFSFRARAVRIMLATPVSQAALRKYHQAERAESRTRAKARYHTAAQRRVWYRRVDHAGFRTLQALRHAYPIRTGDQVTTTTVTFSAIGRVQHIAAPPDAMSSHQALRLTNPQLYRRRH